MSKVGGLSVHELGGNYYIIMFILNISGIGYYNYLVYLINMFFIHYRRKRLTYGEVINIHHLGVP